MLRLITFLFGAILVCTELGLADTVVFKNGDLLRGKVQNNEFEIKAPYGALVVKTEMLIGVFPASSDMDDDELETINHDFLSGMVVFDTLDFSTATGGTLALKKADLKGIELDNRAVTREIETTLFFMVNGDKFSGHLIDDNLAIKTDYVEKEVPANAISRIEFGAKGQTEATVHLNDGSLFSAAIVEKRILIQPDFMRKISVCVGKIARIQFNTKKLVAGQFEATAEVFDFDSDGVPDTRDECPATDCGFVTDESGCRPLSDTDGDGVEDTGDQCPGTPAGVHTDAKGCWVIQSAMFGHNKATINPDFTANLDEIARILEQNPDLKIEVQGHADNTGSAEYNLKLSQSRAGAVVAYLVRKGVDRHRLKAVGYGFSRPVASNETEAGRAQNRRVELAPIY